MPCVPFCITRNAVKTNRNSFNNELQLKNSFGPLLGNFATSIHVYTHHLYLMYLNTHIHSNIGIFFTTFDFHYRNFFNVSNFSCSISSILWLCLFLSCSFSSIIFNMLFFCTSTPSNASAIRFSKWF